MARHGAMGKPGLRDRAGTYSFGLVAGFLGRTGAFGFGVRVGGRSASGTGAGGRAPNTISNMLPHTSSPSGDGGVGGGVRGLGMARPWFGTQA